MKNLLSAARVLALDLASTILFLAIYLLSDNLFLAVGLGMALGMAQIAWQLHRKQPIGSLQWLSVVLVLASGTATFLTRDPLDVATTFGYVWAGLMFASAALNIVLALSLDPKSWAAAMSAWGLFSKIGLFLIQYGWMTMVGRRRAAATASASSGTAGLQARSY